MKAERTPEEAARVKRVNANVMIAVGAVTTACALMAAGVLLSGRGDVPDWMFGGRSAARAASGAWSVAAPKVAFMDWGPAPFARAKKEGKLVLLYLGPAYNAPTARMESELFGDQAVAAFVEAAFVPVRVRSDEAPDLDRRYRATGWPTAAVLLPDGVALDAGVPASAAEFRRWAQAIAEKAAAHPELLAKAEAAAAETRRAAAAGRARVAPLPSAEEADRAAQAALLNAWDPARRTFDRRGPRFPRFERVAALASLDAPWAKALAPEAAKGVLAFQDPADGGFFRAADPDGAPAAREKIAADQAGALDVLCRAAPGAARRLLAFLDKDFQGRGWIAGYALDARRFRASDGADFARFKAEGWRETGAARPEDAAELGRAALACAAATSAQKARAKAAVLAAAKAWNPRLLDEAVALGPALLAAGETGRALSVFRWMEKDLAEGPYYLDRLATGVLPPELDRAPDPALNARALLFARALAKGLPPGAERGAARKRAAALLPWLAARADALDPAVWAALVSGGR